MKRMFVTPAAGLTLRRHRGAGALPVSGAYVPTDQYWRRRLRDGDVVLATPPSSDSAEVTDPDPQPSGSEE